MDHHIGRLSRDRIVFHSLYDGEAGNHSGITPVDQLQITRVVQGSCMGLDFWNFDLDMAGIAKRLVFQIKKVSGVFYPVGMGIRCFNNVYARLTAYAGRWVDICPSLLLAKHLKAHWARILISARRRQR